MRCRAFIPHRISESERITHLLTSLQKYFGFNPDSRPFQPGNDPADVGTRIGAAVLDAASMDGSREAKGYRAPDNHFIPLNPPLQLDQNQDVLHEAPDDCTDLPPGSGQNGTANWRRWSYPSQDKMSWRGKPYF